MSSGPDSLWGICIRYHRWFEFCGDYSCDWPCSGGGTGKGMEKIAICICVFDSGSVAGDRSCGERISYGLRALIDIKGKSWGGQFIGQPPN